MTTAAGQQKRKKKRHGPRPGLWRILTAARRVLPDFLVVGAQRAGTTSAYRYLVQHPQLVRPIRKEVHFFDDEEKYARGEGWYRAHFPTARELAALERQDGRRRHAIEATPAYMFRERAAERMARLLPDAKLVACLRDPVDRALSNWKLVGEWGGQYGPFETEVEHELACLEGRPGPLGDAKPRGLLARGRYAEQLERLWRHYPRARVHVAHSAGLFRDPTGFCRPIFEFLDLEPVAIDVQRVHNRSTDRSAMDPALRARLREYFAPHNRRLFDLLGVDFGWNDGS